MSGEHLSYFRELAARINRAWMAHQYSYAPFPTIAAEALAEFPVRAHVDPAEILKGVLTAPALQLPESRLGEPSVTLVDGGRFYIHALFWLSSTPVVHDHCFSGAFTVLSGGSLHNHLEWQPRREVNELFRIGTLKSKTIELLRPGDVRQILPRTGLIHTLFHLEHPSVSIVVRTYSHEPRQFLYFPPFVAADGRAVDPHRETKLAALEALWLSKHPDAEEITNGVVRDSDLATLFFVLRKIRFSAALSDAQRRAFFERAAQRQPEEVPLFKATFDEEARRNTMNARRAFVHDTDQRFLLALLLNLANREEIDRVMRVRYPEAPADRIVQLVRELASVVGPTGHTGLGPRLTDDELSILESMIRGVPTVELVRDLEARFSDVSPTRVEALIQRLRTHQVLSPLFR